MSLKGVIFDIDGTLVDSNDAHAQSWEDTFAEAGYEVPFEVVRPLIGMGADKLLPKTIGVRDDESLRGAAQIYDGPADPLADYDASLLGKKGR